MTIKRFYDKVIQIGKGPREDLNGPGKDLERAWKEPGKELEWD